MRGNAHTGHVVILWEGVSGRIGTALAKQKNLEQAVAAPGCARYFLLPVQAAR
jgi:hypothetical protein